MNIANHLAALSVAIGARPVGSHANQVAESYIAHTLEGAGFAVERRTFPCFDWELSKTELRFDGHLLPARANPYTLPCHVRGAMVSVATLADLEQAALENKIVVLHGELAREPFLPKNFKFVTIEEQQRTIALLERGKPAAVIAVAASDNNYAPIFEDGDFEIPSVTVASGIGRMLLERPTAPVSLQIDATRTASIGANVIARTGSAAKRRIVVCAHFDTKPGTPGALDNASGVAALLASAEALAAPDLDFSLEWVAFNGEDYYSTPGQMLYLEQQAGEIENLALVINMDGIGWNRARNSVAFFNCPQELETRVMTAGADLVRVEPWYQGDHAMFAMQGVPAIAFSSEGAETLLDTVIHTENDTPALVDPERIAQVVDVVTQIVQSAPIPARR